VTRLLPFLAVAVPYAALLTFLAGVSMRVLAWSRAPVPFRIPTTCGQQKSLPWIKASPLECPSNTLGVVARVLGEVLLFRSLFRNHRPERAGLKLSYAESRLLWLGAMAFHWSLLVVVVRHLRLFLTPVPRAVLAVQALDGFFQIGMPVIYASDIAIVAALLYLLSRRLANPTVRYISLPADYFSLALLLTVVVTGILMRYWLRVDAIAAKQYAIGLTTFSPIVPVGAILYLHIFLVSLLLAWFPFSKLMHMGGIFLSPTRNLANTSRMKRHVNPWHHPVAIHTYEQWEDEFRDKLIALGTAGNLVAGVSPSTQPRPEKP
jgi:nitrate reductase gamma subunit